MWRLAGFPKRAGRANLAAGDRPIGSRPLMPGPDRRGRKIILHSGRVAFGQMDEAVFGKLAPRWRWPEQSLKHAVAPLMQRFLALPMALRERLDALLHLFLQGIYRY